MNTIISFAAIAVPAPRGIALAMVAFLMLIGTTRAQFEFNQPIILKMSNDVEPLHLIDITGRLDGNSVTLDAWSVEIQTQRRELNGLSRTVREPQVCDLNGCIGRGTFEERFDFIFEIDGFTMGAESITIPVDIQQAQAVGSPLSTQDALIHPDRITGRWQVNLDTGEVRTGEINYPVVSDSHNYSYRPTLDLFRDDSGRVTSVRDNAENRNNLRGGVLGAPHRTIWNEYGMAVDTAQFGFFFFDALEEAPEPRDPDPAPTTFEPGVRTWKQEITVDGVTDVYETDLVVLSETGRALQRDGLKTSSISEIPVRSNDTVGLIPDVPDHNGHAFNFSGSTDSKVFLTWQTFPPLCEFAGSVECRTGAAYEPVYDQETGRFRATNHETFVPGVSLGEGWWEEYPIGDMNLDGVFDSTDLIDLMGSEWGPAYEWSREDNPPTEVATYFNGDFNDDGYFDTTDMLILFQAGTYYREDLLGAVVPEPPAPLILLSCFAVFILRRTSTCRDLFS